MLPISHFTEVNFSFSTFFTIIKNWNINQQNRQKFGFYFFTPISELTHLRSLFLPYQKIDFFFNIYWYLIPKKLTYQRYKLIPISHLQWTILSPSFLSFVSPQQMSRWMILLPSFLNFTYPHKMTRWTILLPNSLSLAFHQTMIKWYCCK